MCLFVCWVSQKDKTSAKEIEKYKFLKFQVRCFKRRCKADILILDYKGLNTAVKDPTPFEGFGLNSFTEIKVHIDFLLIAI